MFVAIHSLGMGAVLVFVGYFGAVDWKTGASDWQPWNVGLILGGIGWFAWSLVGAIRATKVTFMVPAVLTVLSSVIQVFSFVGGLARG